MFSFFKRKKSLLPVPEWASFFTQEEFSRFIDIVNRYFEKKQIEIVHDDGVIRFKNESAEFENLGLSNLCQICNQTKKYRWKSLIYGHFNGMKKAEAFNEEFNKNSHDFSFSKPYLGVRIYSTEHSFILDDTLTIGQHVVDGIFAMLVFDFPNSVVNVRPEDTIQWNKNYEELFEIGLQNIRNGYKYKVFKQKFVNFNVWIANADHFFTANIIFDLSKKQQLLGAKGALVGIPHRHTVVIYPIESLEVLEVIKYLIIFIRKLYSEGPGSISENLFWYFENEVTNLPYEADGSDLNFSPPDTFIDALNSLE
ncbi:MAG: hypothetical protein V4722_17605 [Bacteroidota bacterium]